LGADCPNDGFYTIANQSPSCYFFTWQDLEHDHTGNPNGYFMLVNASYQPSDFYLTPVNGLCPGTIFQFAAWVINMDLPGICHDTAVKPNITFSIETTGQTVIKSFNTGDIPPSRNPNWIQYGFFFQTPQGDSDVLIRMTNNAPGGCGNDIALDDITFRPCGPAISVSVNGASGDTVNVCQGADNAYTISSQISAGFTNPAFLWQVSTDTGQTWNNIPNATTTSYTKPQTATGDYEYRVIAAEASNINNAVCRVSSQVVSIDVDQAPTMNVPENVHLCTDDTLVLAVAGTQTVDWTGPNDFTSSDSVITVINPPINYSGKYFVMAKSAYGCALTDSTSVSVYQANVANAGKDTAVCAGAFLQLSGSGGIAYNWSPATGLSSPSVANPIATPADSTTYTLTATAANGCIAKDSVTVAIWANPAADAGPDKKILQGQSVGLDATAAGTGVTYTWQPTYNINDYMQLQPIVNPAQDTTYTLTVTSPYGCAAATSKVFVRVFEKVLIPNAFSPNGDGINDTWVIQKLDTYPEADLFVFNRNGQLLYHSKGNGQPWDGNVNGKHVPFGTYYYLIDLKNDLPKLSGWVEVVY
jgi:gliding motility-associated-like protein